jgi:hypothetical protein
MKLRGWHRQINGKYAKKADNRLFYVNLYSILWNYRQLKSQALTLLSNILVNTKFSLYQPSYVPLTGHTVSTYPGGFKPCLLSC